MFSTVILIILGFISSIAIYTLIMIGNNLIPYYWGFIWTIIPASALMYFAWFGLVMLLVLIFGLFVRVDKNRNKPSQFWRFIVTFVTHQINLIGGVRMKVTGEEKLPKHGPFLFVYNHTSNFDPMMIMDYFSKYDVICITKQSNKKIPIAGTGIHMCGYISINRDDNVEGLKSILLAIDFAKKYKKSIVIAPEGTRSKTCELLPFHAGSFKIATKANIPIVAVGLKNTINIHKNFPKRKTLVNVDILDVMMPEQYKDLNTNEISEKIRNEFVEYLGGK